MSRDTLVAVPQTEVGVTYAKKIKKEEARVDWARPARDLDCHIRGLTPFPGAFFEVTRGDTKTRIKILRAVPVEKTGASGTVLSLTDGITIACGEGALRISELQRAGKGPMSADDFLRGFDLTQGERLA